jgi:hypothetical protein
MRFQSKTPIVLLVVISVAAFALSSCSSDTKEPPPREVVQQLLQQEAESLKEEGEQVDPSLEVNITWEIQSIDVREQSGDDGQSWAGTIRFLITSEQREYNGKTESQKFEKEFHYVWDVAAERWIMS